jgi:hypothetical protein
MLFDRDGFYVNGDRYTPGADAAVVLRTLASTGGLPGDTLLGAEVADLLYHWYRAGYVELRPAASHGKDRPS